MLLGKLGVTGDKWNCTKINFKQIKKNPPYKSSGPGGAGREDKGALRLCAVRCAAVRCAAVRCALQEQAWSLGK